jgi:trk system potassium uptake protein TrkH
MEVFEALCTAFGTAGTGGFGIKNDSLAGYSSYVQIVTTVFMLLFGINFSCYYLLFLRQVKSVLRDEELRWYVGIVVVSIALITWNVFTATDLYANLGEALKHASFGVASIISTTGYSTANHDLWPAFSKGILMILMFTGACAGSTSGGVKLGRILLLLKGLRRDIHKMIHPRQVQSVRVNGNVVDERVMINTSAYIVAYLLIFAISLFIVSLDGFSITTNVTAILACFNNIGPGFELVGTAGNFSQFGYLSKIALTIDMLAGRLEIFPLLLTFSRSVWKKS